MAAPLAPPSSCLPGCLPAATAMLSFSLWFYFYCAKRCATPHHTTAHHTMPHHAMPCHVSSSQVPSATFPVPIRDCDLLQKFARLLSASAAAAARTAGGIQQTAGATATGGSGTVGQAVLNPNTKASLCWKGSIGFSASCVYV